MKLALRLCGKILFIVSMLGVFAVSPAHAFTLGDLDVAVKGGVIMGSVSNRSNPGGIPYAGFPIILGYNLDVSPKYSLALEMSFVLDPKNIAITRSGLDFVGAYHLFGGSRRVIRTFNNIEIASRYAYNISLAMRGGFQHYSASAVINETTQETQSISGNVLETMIGLQYRQDTSETAAIALEVYMTALTFSAAVDATNGKHTMFLLSYRIFL